MTHEGRGRRLFRPRTVRSQVTLTATAVVALVLVLSAFGLVAAQQRILTHGIDEALTQRADNIETDVVRGTVGNRLPDEGDPEDSFLQVLDASGEVVAASDNLVALRATHVRTGGERQVVQTVREAALGNEQFRVLTRPLEGPRGGALVVGKNLDDVNESVNILVASLAVSIPFVTALLAVLVWWLTGRVLRPVEAIRSEVATIQGHALHKRVPTPPSEDEVARLASTMNEMLDRVEEATQRQRRFVADASHELRGPLTRLRSTLEVTLAHPGDQDATITARELMSDTKELQKLVDDLLFLARSESGSLETPSQPVDLDDLVLEEAGRLRRRGRVQVDVSSVSAARTLGDADQLARALRNLSANAERHAEHRVTFELGEVDGRCVLAVADDGTGIAPEHREIIFERFTRLDEARSRDAGGSGLGLAIVRDIVERHDGSVVVGDQPGGGARFEVGLPRSL